MGSSSGWALCSGWAAFAADARRALLMEIVPWKKILTEGRLKVGNELPQNSWHRRDGRLADWRLHPGMLIVERSRSIRFCHKSRRFWRSLFHGLEFRSSGWNLVDREFGLRLVGGKFRNGFDCGHFFRRGSVLRSRLDFSLKRRQDSFVAGEILQLFKGCRSRSGMPCSR